MKKFLLLLFLLPTLAFSQDYLNTCAIIYGSSAQWSNSQMRDWSARNYDMWIGTGDLANINAAKAINPNLKVLVYDLIFRMAPDTVDLKQWCTSKGYNFENFVIRIKAGDSVNVRPANQGQYFINFSKTVGPNLMITSGYNPAQVRFTWDFREPKIGEYLVYKWKQSMDAKNCDGVLADEEIIIGQTNNYIGGLYPLQAPFKDTISSYWAYGSPFRSFTRPWASTMNIIQVRDSLRRARNGWQKVAGDLMKSMGKIYGANWAGVPGNALNNWTYEGKHAAVLQGAYISGEYSYFNPSTDGQETSCLNAVQMCKDIKDSAVTMVVGWTSVGQFPYATGIDFARSKMNALGFWLHCLQPGNSKYYFMPSRQNGQVNFDANPTVNGITAPDSLTLWSYAWKLQYGKPTGMATVVTGTDPAGQGYALYRTTLAKNDNTLQTVAVGRYARGANFAAATKVPVILPEPMFEVLENGTFAPTPVTTTDIMNVQWRVFVKDTLAAKGLIAPPPPPVNPPRVDTLYIHLTDTIIQTITKVVTDTLIRTQYITDTLIVTDTVCTYDLVVKPKQ